MSWAGCKNILVIRPDNMGDLIMSSPAIRAVKQSFDCKITVLTSALAAETAKMIPEIDETIVASLPWVKLSDTLNPDGLIELASKLDSLRFDGCIIFTVYSQNPLPSAMLAWMANIPRRLAYSHENPYSLLNYWVPDEEPFSFIRHQVERDIDLVKSIGATCNDDSIRLNVEQESLIMVEQQLQKIGVKPSGYVILHAGVSEKKREYPVKNWIELARRIIQRFNIPVVFTGSVNEKPLTDHLQKETGSNSYSFGGVCNVSELAALIENSLMLISVNSGPVHIATGVRKYAIVLYSQTNPQHKPWKSCSQVLEYSVSSSMQSKNEVIKYVNRVIYTTIKPFPKVSEILDIMQDRLHKQIEG